MPGRLQLMVLLAAWCGLRFGELAELRRADVDLAHRVAARCGAASSGHGGQHIAGTPKSPGRGSVTWRSRRT